MILLGGPVEVGTGTAVEDAAEAPAAVAEDT